MSTLESVQAIAAMDAKARPGFAVPWYPSLMAMAANYRAAADATRSITPCMLAAVNQRETQGRNILQTGVPPGPGCGVGDFQITSGVDWADPQQPRYPGYGPLLDRSINALVAAKEFLQPAFDQFPDSHLAMFAAYNLGGGNVASEIAKGLSPDAWTTDHDYALDCFSSWVNFAAVSLGLAVDWSTWKG